MRLFITGLILMLFSFCASAQLQVVPDGCVTQVCIPASYKTVTETIIVPAVTYQKPITETVNEQFCIKEAAIESYFECDVNDPKKLKQCSREIPAEFKDVPYQVPTGEFETVIVKEKEVITVNRQVKLKDGYIALVPCEQAK